MGAAARIGVPGDESDSQPVGEPIRVSRHPGHSAFKTTSRQHVPGIIDIAPHLLR